MIQEDICNATASETKNVAVKIQNDILKQFAYRLVSAEPPKVKLILFFVHASLSKWHADNCRINCLQKSELI